MTGAGDVVWQDKAETFGRYLQHLRNLRDKTQKDVADAAGLTHSYISKLENGRQPDINYRTLERIAEALGKTADALIVEGGLVEKKRPDTTEEAEQKNLLMDDLEGMDAERLARIRRAVRELRSAFGSAPPDPESLDRQGPDGDGPAEEE
jgi:transcriptional regulator with XRE-family HTH domain